MQGLKSFKHVIWHHMVYSVKFQPLGLLSNMITIVQICAPERTPPLSTCIYSTRSSDLQSMKSEEGSLHCIYVCNRVYAPCIQPYIQQYQLLCFTGKLNAASFTALI